MMVFVVVVISEVGIMTLKVLVMERDVGIMMMRKAMVVVLIVWEFWSGSEW